MKPKWKKFEENNAEEFEGNLHKGSGNSWAKPGDVSNAVFLIECKITDKKSYSLSLTTWEKLTSQALFSYKYPLLSLKIQDKELVILSKEDFLHLTNKKARVDRKN